MPCVGLTVRLAIAITVTGTVEGLLSTSSCDDGWVTFQDKCYKFINDDEEKSPDALKQCHSLDAVLAYATNENEMNFLKTSVKGMDTYAWVTGLSSYKNVFRPTQQQQYEVDGILRSAHPANDFPKPQLHKDPGANFNCIAYHPHYEPKYSYEYISGMTTVDCHIKLPYVCSGDSDKVVSTETSNYIQNGTKDLFYVSHPQDKQNYTAAQKICGKKGMTLLSIRNQQILNFIDKTLGKRSINKLEPWWTGFKVSYNYQMYNWTGNVPMNESVITWLPIPNKISSRRFLMLGSGNAMIVDNNFSHGTAPYICMKNSTAILKYNCKPGWIRGGGSCYKLVRQDHLIWDKAVKYCSNSGSHLLSVDSKDEMSWLMVSGLMTLSYKYGGLWTSLNDRKQENKFIWSDGSKLDKGIIDWIKPLEEDLRGISSEGQCVQMYTGELIPISCDTVGYYGCQYKTSTGKCQDDDWAYLNGYCYLIRFSPRNSKMRFNNAKAVCRTLVDDRHVTPEVVKIESKEVYNFLAKAYKYQDIGIGLNSLIVLGTWSWADGTKADLSIFPHMAEPDNGGGRGEEDCVAMTARGNLYDMPCNESKLFICEKEIQLTKTSIAGDNGGAALFKSSHKMTVLVLILILLYPV